MANTDLLSANPDLDVGLLLRQFRWKVAVTWLMVLVENLLMALLPLFTGRAIDAQLASESGALVEISIVMGALIVITVLRRLYDTRTYGSMRVWLGKELVDRTREQPVSKVNARLDMSREMVDFLEAHAPELITAAVQVIVSITILCQFDVRLGLSGLSVIGLMALIYAGSHRRFFRFNGALNEQRERQVMVLAERKPRSLIEHLTRLRRDEIRISDTEAILYGSIFFAMFAFVLSNLWLASLMEAVTAGVIFAVLSYSWELVESGLTLPAVLQQWTRLTEIRNRINDVPAIESA